MIPQISQATETSQLTAGRREQLRDVAEQLEAAFLSEMLKGAGLGARKGAFGGGVGEDQFASMLRDRQAQLVVETGGIGLAEKLFQTLLSREMRT
ncbi:rod-binding protein [Maribius pontilimi]|uniref:Rod-binding protein n=1 Tax=Palleronia pontilimi TaxID=1964209 RepID=A0A934I9Y7_9RHOB|nr:rod-binding protein [Palleronia pontilimi]MBJ3763163.1 rod-binding protein [Palleronia pontilimi]